MSCCGKNILSPSTIARGAVGIARAAVKIDRAETEVVKSRRDICAVCPEKKSTPTLAAVPGMKWLASMGRCRICQCFIAAKTEDEKETCPLDLWTDRRKHPLETQ